MDFKRISIAIDGPAGAGKSTVAKIIAEKLGVVYLDTGAMYRGVAYEAVKNGVSVTDSDAVERMLKTLDMNVSYGKGGAQQIFVNGENVTPFIREHSISKAASDVSALKCVRLKMVELQRRIAEKSGVVLDGRDIGTFVLPNADYKFFITASAEERAKRRLIELKSRGADLPFEDVFRDIKERDYNDSHREFAPLSVAADAVTIDTTNMNIDEVVNAVLSKME